MSLGPQLLLCRVPATRTRTPPQSRSREALTGRVARVPQLRRVTSRRPLSTLQAQMRQILLILRRSLRPQGQKRSRPPRRFPGYRGVCPVAPPRHWPRPRVPIRSGRPYPRLRRWWPRPAVQICQRCYGQQRLWRRSRSRPPRSTRPCRYPINAKPRIARGQGPPYRASARSRLRKADRQINRRRRNRLSN